MKHLDIEIVLNSIYLHLSIWIRFLLHVLITRVFLFIVSVFLTGIISWFELNSIIINDSFQFIRQRNLALGTFDSVGLDIFV